MQTYLFVSFLLTNLAWAAVCRFAMPRIKRRSYDEGYEVGSARRWDSLYAEREAAARRAAAEARRTQNEMQGIRRVRISDATIRPRKIIR